MANSEAKKNFLVVMAVVLVMFLIVLANFGSLLLSSRAFIHNGFVDYKHPIQAKLELENVKADGSPNLTVEFEPYEVSQARFYDFLHVPEDWRYNLNLWKIGLLGFIFLLMYFTSIGLITNDEDKKITSALLTVAVPQLIILIALIIVNQECYERPWLSDVQLVEAVKGYVFNFRDGSIVLTLFVFLVVDVATLILSEIIFDDFIKSIYGSINQLFKQLFTLIKNRIINRVTLGNNLMLCCNNGVFELIEIDADLKWIPFPAVSLKRRVLSSFRVGENSTRCFRDWLGDLPVSIAADQMAKLGNLNMNGELLLVGSNNNVELIRLQTAVQWQLFPNTVVTKEVIKHLSFDRFFHFFLADSKQAAFDRLRELLVESHAGRFETVGRDSVIALINGFCAKASRTVKASAVKMVVGKRDARVIETVSLLQTLTDSKLKAFKQEIVNQVQDSIQVTLQARIKEKILSPLRDALASHQPMLGVNGAIDALPDGTKFFFVHGNRQIIIVEQKPQRRSVHFSDNFVGGSGRYNLAFPYVIFLMIFNEGEFSGLWVYYAKKPMVSLNSELFRVNLPNVYDSNSVCTGTIGRLPDNLAQKVETVIAGFWQSCFNNDLRDYCYEPMTERDKNFRNLAKWQAVSQIDPLFVLKTDWLASSVWLPGRVIAEYMGGTINGQLANFDNVINQELFSADGLDVGASVKRICDQVNVNGLYPKKTALALQKHLENLSSDVKAAFRQELLQLIDQRDQTALQSAVNTVVAQAVDQAIAEDFAGCANQVLMRRRIDYSDLVQRIIAET